MKNSSLQQRITDVVESFRHRGRTGLWERDITLSPWIPTDPTAHINQSHLSSFIDNFPSPSPIPPACVDACKNKAQSIRSGLSVQVVAPYVVPVVTARVIKPLETTAATMARVGSSTDFIYRQYYNICDTCL